MSEKRPKYRVMLLLMLLAGWLPSFPASSAPLPLPPGPLDTNVFNTNGLTLSPDVQFLLRDLQTNLAQLQPFLALVNGESITNASNNAAFQTQTPQQPPPQPNSTTNGTNAAPLIYGLGAALENVQTDIQDLLPRLAAMVGQTNYSGNPVSTNNPAVPNRFDTNSAPKQAPQFQKILLPHSRDKLTNENKAENFSASPTGTMILWSARTCPRFGTRRHFASFQCGDVPPHSQAPPSPTRRWTLDFGPWTTFPY